MKPDYVRLTAITNVATTLEDILGDMENDGTDFGVGYETLDLWLLELETEIYSIKNQEVSWLEEILPDREYL